MNPLEEHQYLLSRRHFFKSTGLAVGKIALAGLMFPIENIPAGLRWISNFVWGKYYIEIVRDALLAGGGWPATWFKVPIIGAIGGIFYLIAWRTMRRMQLKV